MVASLQRRAPMAALYSAGADLDMVPTFASLASAAIAVARTSVQNQESP